MAGTTSDLSRLTIRRDDPPEGPRRRPRWIIPAAVILCLVIAAAMFAARRGSAVEVRTAMAEFAGGAGGGGASLLTANGYVVARTQASVASKIMGRLEFLGVIEGSRVERGEVLARLDDRDYAAALAQAEAGVAAARAALAEAEAARDQLRRDVERSRELLAGKVISAQESEVVQSQLTAAEARVATRAAGLREAQAAVEVARANLENTRIRAPFSGTVLRKDAEVGEVVAPAATGTGLTRGAVITMADLSTLEVEVDVNEGYIARIARDQPARITLDAYPDVAFDGRVRQVLPTADRQRATVRVKVAIVKEDPRILPEMGARVDFLPPETGAAAGGPEAAAATRVVVPAEAVRDESGRAVAWIVKDDRLARREVTAGPVSGGRREIREGLSGGERVVVAVVKGRLAEGARVKTYPAP